MANLVMLVLPKRNLLADIVQAWEEAGVPGLSMLESYGITHVKRGQAPRDDLPLVPSLRALLGPDEVSHRLIFSVVPDDFDLDGLIRKTEALTGNLDEPSSGFLFVVPVSRVRGLHRKA